MAFFWMKLGVFSRFYLFFITMCCIFRFMRKCNLIPFLFLCFLFSAPAFLFSQTAAELESILEKAASTNAEAAWFVAGSVESGDSAEFNSAEEAFEMAMSRGWLVKKAEPEKPITMEQLSFLMVKAFDIKGGLMYRIISGPRYSYRTMVSRSFIQGASDPKFKVSGERFLLILGNVMNTAGGGQ
jgi:hypothetical protein